MAGHDFLTNQEMQLKTSKQDWSVCCYGSVHNGAVKQAVKEFVEREQLQLGVTQDEWPTWIVRKGWISHL